MKVMIAGYFDPLHEGHLDHIRKAARLGDYLYIVTHTDECTEMVKKDRYTTLPFREIALRGLMLALGIKGIVVVTPNEDIALAIRIFRPDIFAKGGDRTASNMPEVEIEACREVNCKIVYGVGDLLNSSSNIKRRLRR